MDRGVVLVVSVEVELAVELVVAAAELAAAATVVEAGVAVARKVRPRARYERREIIP